MRCIAMEPNIRLVLNKCIYLIAFLYLCSCWCMMADGVCYSDSSLRTDDKIGLVSVVVKARVQSWTQAGDLMVRVTKTLKGDPQKLDKKDIRITGLEAEGPFRMGSTEPRVTKCMQNAIPKEKYILFLQETDQDHLYTMQFDGVVNSKKELRVLRKVIERENESSLNTTTEALLTEDSANGNATTSITTENTYATSPNLKASTPNLKASTQATSTKHYTGCPRDGYCFNGGECAYLIKLKKYVCFCNKPWQGERCQLLDPYASSDNGSNLFGSDMRATFITLGVIFGALLLVTLLCAVAYVKYKSSYYQDRRDELEDRLRQLSESTRFEDHEAQPLNRSPHRTDSRHSNSETEFFSRTPPSTNNNSHLLQSRHYSLQETQVQPTNTDYTSDLSDNTFSPHRTSIV